MKPHTGLYRGTASWDADGLSVLSVVLVDVIITGHHPP